MKRVIVILFVIGILAILPNTVFGQNAECNILLSGATTIITVPHGTLDQVTNRTCVDGDWFLPSSESDDAAASPYTVCGIYADHEPQTVEFDKVSNDGHIQRLAELDAVYRAQGSIAWARAAGLQWDGLLCAVERQPEEILFTLDMGTEDIADDEVRLLVVKIQMQAPTDQSIRVTWPAFLTSDHIDAISFDETGGGYQPDTSNPSWTCTQCWLAPETTFTLGGDGGNDENLWPENREIPEWAND